MLILASAAARRNVERTERCLIYGIFFNQKGFAYARRDCAAVLSNAASSTSSARRKELVDLRGLMSRLLH